MGTRAVRATSAGVVRRPDERRYLAHDPRPLPPVISSARDNPERHSESEANNNTPAHGKHESATPRAHSETEERIARTKNELRAAVGNMESATQRILNAAETIDESARALHATLKTDYNRGLSQDIIDQVVRIYEACNFQDLSGQHIGKAVDALTFIEQRVAGMADIRDGREAPDALASQADRPDHRGLVNGPMIAGDSGHVDQDEVDSLFGCA